MDCGLVLFFIDIQVRKGVSWVHYRDLFCSRWHHALGNVHVFSTPSVGSVPSVAFETVPVLVWLTRVLSRPLKDDHECFRFLRLPPPGDRWCDVLGCVPVGDRVWSSSKLQVFGTVLAGSGALDTVKRHNSCRLLRHLGCLASSGVSMRHVRRVNGCSEKRTRFHNSK